MVALASAGSPEQHASEIVPEYPLDTKTRL
jgi:hypothetical protein